MGKNPGYKPISDYGLIGNLRTAALVGRDGSIDWFCLPYLDSPSIFAALLDARQGGRFRIRLKGAGWGEQAYSENTNILRTRFRAGNTVLTVTDFMPLSGPINGCCEAVSSQAPPEIHRRVECTAGVAEVEVEWAPRFDYARTKTRIKRSGDDWLATGDGESMTLTGVAGGEVTDDGTGSCLRAGFTLRFGECRDLITFWGSKREVNQPTQEALRQTMDIWAEWIMREDLVNSRGWAGEFEPLVMRSALVLKLLTFAATGAIAAAATTSLPEVIGGVRNWDYRYSWLRDSGLTAQALASVGHQAEALDLLRWMERTAEKYCEQEWDLRIMYDLRGGMDLEEHRLDHLEGYRGSRPVRIGNEAAKQFQLETYGELLSIGYELARRGNRLGTQVQEFLCSAANHVLEVWHEPDSGIWEMRGEKRHFVYSKIMAWTALDRAILLAERFGFPGDAERWRAVCREIRAEVLDRGYDEELGSFVMSYGSKDLDAANLRIPLLEFLPAEDPRVQSTIARTMEQLGRNGFIRRYIADDGLPGEEGAFGLCTFWLVDALALSGHAEEARDLLTRMARHANHLGLYPEQFDPEDGSFLGNFPQAFTHIGLINSAIYLAYAEGRETLEHAPVGTSVHRGNVDRA